MPSKAALRGLYLVTPDTPDTDYLLKQVAFALGGRPAMLQYRSKQTDFALRRLQAEAVAKLCRQAGVPFVVNDSLELALMVEADGVHLGRDDGDPRAARAALGRDGIVGVTCYNEWARAEAGIAAGVDYVAFGAIFASPTKPAAVHAPLDLFSRAKRELSVPIAAIGGITLENAPQALNAGVDLLAVISDVFEAPDPGQRVRAYQSLFAD